MKRRAFLATTGAATIGGVAGCLGGGSGDGQNTGDGQDTVDDSGDGQDTVDGSGDGQDTSDGSSDGADVADQSSYAVWFESDTDEHRVRHLDFERADELDSYHLEELVSTEESGPIEELEESFPEISSIAEGYPAVSGFDPLFKLSFMGFVFPFLVDVEFVGRSSDVENPVMTAAAISTVDTGIVLEGTVDEAMLRDYGFVEQVDSHAGYTIYETPVPDFGGASDEDESDQEDRALFVADSEHIVFPLEDSNELADGEGHEQRRVAESAIDTVNEGVAPGNEEMASLVEQVGGGALVFGDAGSQVDTDGDELLLDFDMDPAERETFRELLDEHVEAVLMVTDAHENGRVTRSGLAFQNEAAVPDEEELTDLLAPDAEDVDVTTQDNHIVVEAFWE